MGLLKYLPTLQLVAASTGGELRDLTSHCGFEDGIKSSISFNYYPADSRINEKTFVAGNCAYGDVEVQRDDPIDIDGKYFTPVKILYDASQCASEITVGEGNLPSSKALEFNFDTGLGEVDGVFLVLRKHVIPAKCTFQESYTLEYDFGKLNAGLDPNEPQETESGITFEMVAYSDPSRTTQTLTDVTAAGDMTYVTISPNDALPDGLSYAPVECKLVERATECTESCNEINSFTLFNPPEKVCQSSEDLVNLKMSYDNSDSSWDFEFMLFVFDPFNLNDYNLVCNIKVCHTSKNPDDTCNAVAKSCLHSEAENFFTECAWNVKRDMCACEPGQKFNLDNECESCEFGSVSDGQSNQCTVCPAGTQVIENICTPCAAGDREVEHKCEACPVGTTSTASSTICSELKYSWLATQWPNQFNNIGNQIATDDEHFYVPGYDINNRGQVISYNFMAGEFKRIQADSAYNGKTFRGVAVKGTNLYLTCVNCNKIFHFTTDGFLKNEITVKRAYQIQVDSCLKSSQDRTGAECIDALFVGQWAFDGDIYTYGQANNVLSQLDVIDDDQSDSEFDTVVHSSSNIFYGRHNGDIMKVDRFYNGARFTTGTAKTFNAHDSEVKQLRVVNQYLVSASTDKTIKIWDTSSGLDLLKEISFPNGVLGLDVKTIQGQTYIFSFVTATSGEPKEIQVRDLSTVLNGDTDTTVLKIENENFGGACFAVEYHVNTQHLLVGCSTGDLFQYKLHFT